LHAERLLSEVVPKPVVPHTNEKDADEDADLVNGAEMAPMHNPDTQTNCQPKS
jgi:hypothetical protein